VPVGVKILFTAFVLVVGSLMLYAIRPSQTRGIGTRFWRGGACDPLRRLLYRENGLPHSYTWKIALAVFTVWLLVLWLVPSD
jgi:hypothetical protein